MKTLLAILILATISSAQSLSDAPSHVRPQWQRKPNILLSPFKDPAFYIGVGNHAASALFDVHSTKVCEANRTCVEAYPGHERYSYIVPLILLEAGAQYGCSLMLSNHKRLRWGCLGISAAMSFYHWKDSRNIYANSRTATR